jgi:hypothetical protein
MGPIAATNSNDNEVVYAQYAVAVSGAAPPSIANDR